ncbi:MAG TPA: sulfatase, partial [Opitutaceae bacterium]|nr:sulfatase [Opitutaceae bacterium]
IYTVGTLERGTAPERRMLPPENVEQLPLDKYILPQAIKAAGYATGMFGKWHLGNAQGYHPLQRGFDEAIVSMGAHFDFQTSPKAESPKGQYLADFLTDRAVDFIARHKDQPFFLYLPHFAVHVPIHAKAEYIEAWQKKPVSGTHWNPTYAAMIQSLDESVGRVVAKLDELKLADNTVVIFSSDNGGLGGYQRTEAPSEKKGNTDNAPLRGGKGTLYEGGLRVPFIVRWPGVIRPGTTSEVPLAHVDIYPTFVDIAHGQPRAGYVLDGVSFVPTLRSPGAKPAREAIYWHFPGYLESYVHPTGFRTTPAGAIHAGDFKLLEFFETNRVELYDVKADIGERNDLAGQMPEKVAALRSELAAWRKRVGAQMPVFKTDAQLAADRAAPPPKKQKKAGKREDDEK